MTNNQQPKDLNHAAVPADDTLHPLDDPSTTSGSVECVFRNIEDRLTQLIRSYDAVVGCVAWLTNFRILDALSEKRFVQIVLQKEDFLRPDHKQRGSLREKYQLVGRQTNGRDDYWNTPHRFELPGLVADLSTHSDLSVPAFRCVGLHNADRGITPRAHHKFVVLGNLPPDRSYAEYLLGRTNRLTVGDQFQPELVWTGSFNFTINGTRSLENAIIVHDSKIARAYYDEWAQVFAMSESLDWKRPWIAPEYRIGS